MKIRVNKVHVEGDGSFWRDKTVYRLVPNESVRYIDDAVLLDLEDGAGDLACSYKTGGDAGAELYLARTSPLGFSDPYLASLKSAVGGDFSIERFVSWPDIGRVPEYVRINLLLDHAYRKHDRKGAACAGKLIFVYKKGGKSSDKRETVQCLQVFVDSRNVLHLDVRTMARVDGFVDGFVTRVSGVDKHVWDYPAYKMAADGCLVPSRYGREGDTEYIPHLYPGWKRKSEMKFMVLSFAKDASPAERDVVISRTKMGVLADVLQRFSEVYDGRLSIMFEKLEQEASFRADAKMLTALDVLPATVGVKVDTGLLSLNVKIADLLDMLDTLDIDVVDGYEPYLYLIGDPEDYKKTDVDDPYDELASSLTYQRMTPLSIDGTSSRDAVRSALRELAFKQDVMRGMIGVTDWSSFGISRFRLFAPSHKCIEPAEGSYGEPVKSGRVLSVTGISLLEIGPGGEMSYKFAPYEDCLFDPDFDEACDAFTAESASERPVMLVDIDGATFKIFDTGMYPVPNDLEGIDEALLQGGTNSYRANIWKEYFCNILDVRFSRDPNGSAEDYLYHLGTSGMGLRKSISRASPIRRISPVKGEIPVEKFAALLTVDGVRLGSPTVLPFPAKHLRIFEDEEVKARYRAGGTPSA